MCFDNRDLKALVEDYIDNKSAVRMAVGLGPRIKPPFYRYDYFHAVQDAASSNSDALCTCGICKEDVSFADAYATNCFVSLSHFSTLLSNNFSSSLLSIPY